MEGKIYHDCKDIQVSEIAPIGMTEDDIAEAKTIEKWLINHDICVEETQRSKNDLENFVYDTRKKVTNK